MTYLILANLSLILFFVIYILVLKRLTFFQWNRIYLLGAIAISFVIPLLQFVDLSLHREVYRRWVMIEFGEMESVAVTDVARSSGSWSVIDWIQFVYIIGVVVMLLWLSIRLYRVFTTFKTNACEQRSFSFLNWVFIAEATQHRDVIASHEQIHMKQGHSYDILFVEAVRVLNWFNPIFYFYLKELKLQHECIADKACSGDKVQYAELLVANAMGISHGVLVHEFSNQSFLKQRIMMLFKNKSKKINRINYMIILPALLLVSGMALAFNVSIRDVVVPGAEDVENIVQQDTTKRKVGEDTVSVFTAVEISPEPKEGMNAFRVWIGENYRYPQDAVDAGVKGRIVISFIVEADGQLSNFKIIEDLGH